jgi:hypothetical protein
MRENFLRARLDTFAARTAKRVVHLFDQAERNAASSELDR